MRILFVIDSIAAGGAQRQLVELIKGLDQHRYKIHLICLNHTKNGYTDLINALDIKVSYFCRSYKFDISPIFRTANYIKRERIELVHTFLNLGSLVGLIASKICGMPVICSGIRDGKNKSIKEKVSKIIFAWFADVLTANSYAGFNNRFRAMRPNFRVVYNGIDFNRFQIGKNSGVELKKQFGLTEYEYIVGMVATLSDKKDHETLLNSVPIIRKRFPKTCILFVGDGPKRNMLKKIVKNLGLEKSVFFLGYQKKVDQIYQTFDVFVLLTNSDILEGTPNVVLEAMAAGVPVIASKGGGTDEIIKHNINGVMVTPKNAQETADAIIDLLGDREKAQLLSKNAKGYVKEKFNLQRYVKDYEEIYRDLLPQKEEIMR